MKVNPFRSLGLYELPVNEVLRCWDGGGGIEPNKALAPLNLARYNIRPWSRSEGLQFNFMRFQQRQPESTQCKQASVRQVPETPWQELDAFFKEFPNRKAREENESVAADLPDPIQTLIKVD